VLSKACGFDSRPEYKTKIERKALMKIEAFVFYSYSGKWASNIRNPSVGILSADADNQKLAGADTCQ